MSTPRRTLWVLSATVFLVMTGIQIVIPVMPAYGVFLGVSEFFVGFLIGALPLARVFLDLPSGVLGDRYGNRRMMMIGLAIIAVSSFCAVIPGVLGAGAASYALLVSIRVAEGVGSAFYVTSSLAALAKSAPEDRRGAHMSFYVSALLIGQTIGPTIGGVAAHFGGLLAPFWVYGSLATAGLLLLRTALPALPGSDGMPARVDWAAVRSLLHERSFVLVNVGTMAAFFIRAGLINTVLPFYVAQILGFDLTTDGGRIATAGYVGVLITVTAVTSLATMYPAGVWSDRRGRKMPFVVSLVLMGLTAPLIYFARDWWLLVGVMGLYGLVLGLHGPLASWASDLVPKAKMGTGMGLYRTIGDLGFLLGPLVMGGVLDLVLVSSNGVPTDVTLWPFLLAGAWMVASGLLLLLARDPVAERLRQTASARAATPARK